MTLARDFPSDYMRGYRNGAASVLAAVGRDPRGVLEHEQIHLVSDVVIPAREFEQLVTRAETADRAQAEVDQLRAALALLDAELHTVIQCAMGSVVNRSSSGSG